MTAQHVQLGSPESCVEQVAATIYREARVLDDRLFEEWLTLFTDDGIYWLPMEDVDPLEGPSLCYDDSDMRERRVYRLLHTPAYSQIPPSETIHAISNLEIGSPAPDGSIPASCVLALHELRGGDYRQYGLGQARTIAGRCDYLIREQNGRYKIAMKRVRLLTRRLPISNLSFIV